MLAQHRAAAVVHEPCGGADIGVGVAGDVFFDEVDQARVALEQAEKLERGVGARFLQHRCDGHGARGGGRGSRRGRGCGRCGRFRRIAQALHPAGELGVAENAEKRAESYRHPAEK